MPFRIPKRLTINGRSWRVVYRRLRNLGLYGQTDMQRRVIELDSEMTEEEREDTFMHEVMHACLCESWPNRTEESMVGRLTPRLLAALKGCGWLR